MFGHLLKQSTATTIRFGPLVQLADGGTVMPSLTIAKANVKLTKNGAALASAHSDQGASDAGAPYDSLGTYAIALDTTDTNTLGRLSIIITPAGTRPLRMDFTVVSGDVYRQLISAEEDIGEDSQSSRVYYVRTTGSDSNDGLTVATAKLTIGAAATLAKRGDSINADAVSANDPTVDFSALTVPIRVN